MKELKVLIHALATNTTLKALNLSSNNIIDYNFVKDPATNSTLEQLDLSNNPSLVHWGGKFLQVMSLTTGLKKLDLSRSSPWEPYDRTDEKRLRLLTEALASNHTLKKLDLRLNGIYEASESRLLAFSLASNSVLEKLHLGCKKNESKENLHFRNQIADSGAMAFAQALTSHIMALKKLHLSYNNIGESGAEKLAQALMLNTTLRNLDLYGNEIGKQGAIEFSKALCLNSALKTLDVGDNKIDDEGAEALYQALTKNKTLRKLRITDNQISHNLRNRFYDLGRGPDFVQFVNHEQHPPKRKDLRVD